MLMLLIKISTNRQTYLCSQKLPKVMAALICRSFVCTGLFPFWRDCFGRFVGIGRNSIHPLPSI